MIKFSSLKYKFSYFVIFILVIYSDVFYILWYYTFVQFYIYMIPVITHLQKEYIENKK